MIQISPFHWKSLLFRFLGAILAGSLWFLSFPPFEISGFVWLVPIPLLFAIFRPTEGSRKQKNLLTALTGFIFGLTAFGGMFFWINEVSTLGYICLTFYLSIYPCIFALIARKIGKLTWPAMPEELTRASVRSWAMKTFLPSLGHAALLAAAWVSIEWLRGWIFTGFGWNGLGIGLRFSLPLWQMAEWIGANALAFLPFFTGSVIFYTGARLGKLHKLGRRSSHWDLLASMCLIGICFSIGFFRISQIRQLETKPLNALIIQRNHSLTYKQSPQNYEKIANEYIDATQQGLENVSQMAFAHAQKNGSGEMPNVDWVLWPESAVPYPNFRSEKSWNEKQWNKGFINFIDENLRKEYGNFTLISGADEIVLDPKTQELLELYNTMATWNGNFDTIKSQAKSHLVPFGEYIPLRKELPFLEQAFEWSSGQKMGEGFSSGTTKNPLTIKTNQGDIEIIPAICFEDTLGRVLRPFVRANPQVIVNLTNDNWFGESAASTQHFWNSQIRTIELRRPMLRAANTGISAAITSTGEITHAYYPWQKKGILLDEKNSPFFAGDLFATIPVPQNPPTTLYALWGNWFDGLCGLLTFLALIAPYFKKFFPSTPQNPIMQKALKKAQERNI